MTTAITAPSLTAKQIIRAAEGLIRDYFVKGVGRDKCVLGVNFDSVYEQWIYPQFGVSLIEDTDLGCADDGQRVLGQYDFRRNVVYIDRALKRDRDPRRAFTCWHEVGHALLQGAWLRAKLPSETAAIATTEAMLKPETVSLLEHQANLFASHAGAPAWLVIYAVRKTFQFYNDKQFLYAGPGEYSFCFAGAHQRRHIDSLDQYCWFVGSFIKGYFGGLSSEALGYRVRDCGLVKDRSIPRHPVPMQRPRNSPPDALHRVASGKP